MSTHLLIISAHNNLSSVHILVSSNQNQKECIPQISEEYVEYQTFSKFSLWLCIIILLHKSTVLPVF